ncbi:unnamed protein product [Candida verbasci]|uniref:Uncharacterized protein n=1 Tax=Candida verbasci TaxID=1227364 RepID=A0A9W4TT36_9ASCO|nr:unnamed protein product [Candida verbasci]
MSNAINELIETSWKITKGNADYIFMSQARPLINEIQKILRIDSIFNEQENKLIDQFIHEKPTRKLNKYEFRQFLINSVHYASLEELFVSRFKMDCGDVRRCLDEYSNENITQPVSKLRAWEEIKQRDDFIREQTTTIESYESKYNRLLLDNNEQKIKIERLQNEIEILNNYIKSMQKELSKTPGESKTSSLLNKLKDRDIHVKNLDQVCKEYKSMLKQYEKKELEINNVMKDLEKTILEQDKLINNLQEKFALQNTESKIKNFLISIPIIKQCYMSLKYKQDNKITRIFILNITSLVLTFLLFANIINACFRFVFAIFYYITSSKYFDKFNYVYDNYGHRFQVLEIWRRIPFLEQLIYRVINW